MSYSPLLKYIPDWFSQETLQKTLETLRQPFSLALLASLGIHGFLLVILPLLPGSKSDEFDTKQTVKVVELNPAEQLRLPEFMNPQLSPPPNAKSSNLQSKQSKLPSSTKSAPSLLDDSSLYNFPLVPLPPVTVLPPLIDPPLLFGNKKPVVRDIPQPDRKPSPSTTPSATPEATASPQASPSPSASPASVRPEKIPAAAIARLQELQAQQRDGQSQGSTTNGAEGIAQVTIWLSQIARSEKVDAKVLYDVLLDKEKQEGQKNQTRLIPCPIDNCPATELSLVVAVNPQGKIIRPVLQTKTDNANLDQAIQKDVQTLEATLKATGSYQIYFIRIQFDDPAKKS